VGGAFYEVGSQGVGFNVARDSEVVVIVLDREALEATLIEMAYADGSVGDVETLSVSEGCPSHEFGDVAIGFGPKQ